MYESHKNQCIYLYTLIPPANITFSDNRTTFTVMCTIIFHTTKFYFPMIIIGELSFKQMMLI